MTLNGQGWANEPAAWWDQVYLFAALYRQVEKEVEGLAYKGQTYVDFE